MTPSRPRLLALLVLSALLAAACAAPVLPEIVLPPTEVPTAVPTSTPSVVAPTPPPYEDEPGLTADTMRIAVIVDVDTLDLRGDGSEPVWQAMQAWARSVNENGRLANRFVSVELVDAAILRSADAIDKVCNGDFFAIVGSASLIDDEGLDQLQARDCALPDFPARVTSLARLDSATTFVSNPINGSIWNAGFARYFANAYPEGVAAAGTMLVDALAPLVIAGEQMIEVASQEGYEFVYNPFVDIHPDFELVAGELAGSTARSLTWRNNARDLIDLLVALDTVAPDRTFDFIDCGQRCYDPAWVEEAGDLGDGVSVWLPTLPIEDLVANAELIEYLHYLQDLFGDDAHWSAMGIAAWSAGLLFQEAVNGAVGAGTAAYDPTSLTRASVVEAAKTITEWDAHGLQGVANPAERIPSPCFVVLTLSQGSWERTYPSRSGTQDCSEANLVELEVTAGASAGPLPTPTAGPTPTG